MAAPSSHTGEQLIRIVSQHWIKYMFPSFVYAVLLLVSVLLFILAGMTAHHSVWLSHFSFLLALVLFLGTHHWFFLVLLCESTAHVIITDHRVVFIRDRLFLDEQMAEYAFTKMKTVQARKHGLLQTVLRYGTLHFESGADVPLVPHPNRVAKEIEQAMGLR